MTDLAWFVGNDTPPAHCINEHYNFGFAYSMWGVWPCADPPSMYSKLPMSPWNNRKKECKLRPVQGLDRNEPVRYFVPTPGLFEGTATRPLAFSLSEIIDPFKVQRDIRKINDDAYPMCYTYWPFLVPRKGNISKDSRVPPIGVILPIDKAIPTNEPLTISIMWPGYKQHNFTIPALGERGSSADAYLYAQVIAGVRAWYESRSPKPHPPLDIYTLLEPVFPGFEAWSTNTLRSHFISDTSIYVEGLYQDIDVPTKFTVQCSITATCIDGTVYEGGMCTAEKEAEYLNRIFMGCPY